MSADRRARHLTSATPAQGAARAIEIEEIDPESAEAQRCLQAYVAELNERFPEGYGAGSLVDPGELRSEGGCLLVARSENRTAGCGVLRRLDSTCGEIKHLWVSPAYRGLGLSRRLLSALETAAAERGFGKIRLDTHRALVEAVALYRSAGYKEIPAYGSNPHAGHWFERDL